MCDRNAKNRAAGQSVGIADIGSDKLDWPEEHHRKV